MKGNRKTGLAVAALCERRSCVVGGHRPPLQSIGLLFAALALAASAVAQPRPYIGYTYPAGGQQATTVQVKLGGQALDDVNGVLITGDGVTGRIVEYYRKLGPQEIQVLNEQLRELKRAAAPAAKPLAPKTALDEAAKMSAATAQLSSAGAAQDNSTQSRIAKIEYRVREWVQVPACASISGIAMAEITISPEAAPGPRELRLMTPRGISNPLVFHVGQLNEYSRKPMRTANIQILGKEVLALRKRPPEEAEVRIDLPCTVNGQIASGEVNRYRFTGRKGERLVLSTQARQLIPFIADAVPGWFQPVLALYDAQGRELAYADDDRFKPDPVILYQLPEDGEYVFAIQDSIFRGREDFVYRITAGELPFVTSIFPLGGPVDGALPPNIAGWNLGGAGIGWSYDSAARLPLASAHWMGCESNRVPFALGRLPEEMEREPNNTVANAQAVTLPLIVNGRIERTGDTDVFAFTGKANDRIVAEVQARRLDSPLDSVIKLTDAAGKVLAVSDDHEDLGAGVNTHHADSVFLAQLPADGTYFVHLGDTAHQGGPEYGYRLRISAPQPDFELRVVPSSISLAVNTTAAVTVYAVRKEGFTGPIKLALDQAPYGYSANPVTLAPNQTSIRFSFKAAPSAPKESVKLSIVGTAKAGEQMLVHEAAPAEDRMQAFLWRHLVPAAELRVLAFDPRVPIPPKRVPRPRAPALVPAAAMVAAVAVATPAPNSLPAVSPAPSVVPATAPKPKFTKQQIVGRLRMLKLLYEEGLLTDDFYDGKVAECDTPQ